MLHINKGRLHAFRKLSPFALPSFDCHAELRAQLLKKIDNPGEEKTCTSIAWDWEFKGVTAEGIDQEVTSMLECSKLNRERKVGSLGVAETSILFMARRHVSEYKELSETAGDSQDMAFLPFKSAGPSASATDSESSGLSDAIASPSAQSSLQVLRGLLPSLSYVVDRHKKAHEHAKQMEANGDEKRNVSIAPRSDAQESFCSELRVLLGLARCPRMQRWRDWRMMRNSAMQPAGLECYRKYLLGKPAGGTQSIRWPGWFVSVTGDL